MIIMEYLDRSSASTRASTSSFTSADAFSDSIPERPVSAPMRMPTFGIYNVKGVGDVLAGRVEQGVVKPNDEDVLAGCVEQGVVKPNEEVISQAASCPSTFRKVSAVSTSAGSSNKKRKSSGPMVPVSPPRSSRSMSSSSSVGVHKCPDCSKQLLL